MQGAIKSPIFEFYVYSLYRMRGESQVRARIFRSYTSGHLLAQKSVDSIEEQQEITELKRFNKVDMFMKCIKRKGVESKPESFRGVVEFVSEVELNDAQVKFFHENRVMMS